LARIPVSIGGLDAKTISNDHLHNRNWFFNPDDGSVSIDGDRANGEQDKRPTFFEGRFWCNGQDEEVKDKLGRVDRWCKEG
jgi:hypothetical protein